MLNQHGTNAALEERRAICILSVFSAQRSADEDEQREEAREKTHSNLFGNQRVRRSEASVAV